MKTQNLFLVLFLLIGMIAAPLVFGAGFWEDKTAPQKRQIRLATTTSTDNSGLLDYLLPRFTEATGYEVQVIAVGTGAALQLGMSGDVDVVLVHARAREDDFVTQGYGPKRYDVMYNDFVVIGPKADPAGISGAESATEAFSRIAGAGAAFISRGDDSGTHIKERSVWEAAGIDPGMVKGNWYKEVGQGMGTVITMTNESEGYTITDRGTFIAMKDSIDLVLLHEGDRRLFNPYGIIAVSVKRHPHVNAPGAEALIQWITGEEGQRLIGSFKMGQEQLFYPENKPESKPDSREE